MRLATRREQAELHDEAGDDAGCCGESKGEFHSRTLLRWSHDVATVTRALATRTAAERVAMS